MKVCLAACYKHHLRHLHVLRPFLEKKGHVVVDKLSTPAYDDLPEADINIVWNGVQAEPTRKTLYAEVGWLPGAPTPQDVECIYVDPKGVNAMSSLRDWSPAGQIYPADKVPDFRKEVERFISDHGWDRIRERERYTLVVLQLPGDTNLVEHGRGWTNEDLIRYAETIFDGPVIVKRHPRDDKEYKTEEPIVTEGDIWEWIRRARGVVGINSTALVQAYALGKPITVLGNTIISHRTRDGRYFFLYEIIFRRQIYLKDPEESLRNNRVLEEVFG